MTIKYKLVTQDYKTRKGRLNETTWKIGEWVEATGDPNQGLCSDGWLHCYDNPLLAVLLNPIHANIQKSRLLEVIVEGEGKNDKGLKRGYHKMQAVREIPLPEISNNQRVAFAILCAKAVCDDTIFTTWADGWLSGIDRTAEAAQGVKEARTAEMWAEWPPSAEAAQEVVEAARAAAWAAMWAEAEEAARAAAWAAGAARAAAAWMAAVRESLDLVAIVEEAMKY